MIHDAGADLVCCGEKMDVLAPNTVDASNEKHLPVVTVEGNEVTVHVGSVTHPMAPEHFIQWIYLETDKGGMMKQLAPGEAPEAKFTLTDEKAVAAYDYCNLHGLWKTEI